MHQTGERLRFWLAQRRMTQRDLAVASGVTEAAVSKYVNGEREPRAITLTKLASALGVSTDELMGVVPTPADDLENSVTLLARNMDQLTDDQRERIIRALASRPRK
ncbi:MAG: helix-turn-helix transcriptional regulator [Atopobiaceae bacterium]|nr:helix-turn-helix transcriptional regulator [Atopobiaceae bacterium]